MNQWITIYVWPAGFPQAIVAHCDLRSSSLEARLTEYSALPNVRGIRQLANWDSDPDFRACDQDLLSDRVYRSVWLLLLW